MPELPEVETTRRGVRDAVVGRTITAFDLREPRLRWPVEPGLAAQLAGQRVLRRAAPGQVPAARPRPWLADRAPRHVRQPARDACRDRRACCTTTTTWCSIRASACASTIRAASAACSGAPAPSTSTRCSPHSGRSRSRTRLTADYLAARARRRKAAVKLFLMDQHVVVGVGNIYASEALFRAGIRPRRGRAVASGPRNGSASSSRSARCWARRSQQGGTTLRDYVEHGRHARATSASNCSSTSAPASPAGSAPPRSATWSRASARRTSARPARVDRCTASGPAVQTRSTRSRQSPRL